MKQIIILDNPNPELLAKVTAKMNKEGIEYELLTIEEAKTRGIDLSKGTKEEIKLDLDKLPPVNKIELKVFDHASPKLSGKESRRLRRKNK